MLSNKYISTLILTCAFVTTASHSQYIEGINSTFVNGGLGVSVEPDVASDIIYNIGGGVHFTNYLDIGLNVSNFEYTDEIVSDVYIRGLIHINDVTRFYVSSGATSIGNHFNLGTGFLYSISNHVDFELGYKYYGSAGTQNDLYTMHIGLQYNFKNRGLRSVPKEIENTILEPKEIENPMLEPIYEPLDLRLTHECNQHLLQDSGINSNVKLYTVTENDWLSKIAIRFCVSLEDLVSFNTDVLDNINLIHPGLVLKIPAVNND